MPSLDPRFFLVDDVLQSYFVDKDTGFPLAGGIVTFYEDNDPNVLKPVYQLSETPGNNYVYNVLPNPLQLSNVGTFMDENGNDILPYYFPYSPGYNGSPGPAGTLDLYFVTVYSAQGVFQFSRQALPNLAASGIEGEGNFTGNLLTNPQFAFVSFNGVNTPVVLNVTGTNTITPIAPDWDLITSGSGTVTVEQIAVAGNNPIPSNPPYLLDITSTGITSLQLRQRLLHNPTLLAQKIVGGSFVASSEDGLSHQLIMSFVPSTGANPSTPYQLINVIIPPTGFAEYSSSPNTLINGTINQDSSTVGYVDVILTIPPLAHIQITSLQLVGVPSLDTPITFTETTVNEELNGLFHYYYNSIILQPKDTMLIAWNFSQNPFQLSGMAVIPTISQTQYIADQTIIHTIGAAGSVATGQSSAANRQCLTINSVTGQTANQFALIQYIEPLNAMPYWSYVLSCLVRSRIFTTAASSVGIKMRLIYSPNVPVTLGNAEPIASWSAGSDPVFSANWTAIAPLNDPTYILPNAYSLSLGTDAILPVSFNDFQLPPMTSSTMTLGVVIYTTENMSASAGDSIVFDRISCVPNEFAIDSSPQTFSQVLSQCERYVETTYDYGNTAGTVTSIGNLSLNQFTVSNGSTAGILLGALTINFRTPKWSDMSSGVAATNFIFYSPTGAKNEVLGTLVVNGTPLAVANIATSNYSYQAINQKSALFSANTGSLFNSVNTASVANYGFVSFHYLCNLSMGSY